MEKEMRSLLLEKFPIDLRYDIEMLSKRTDLLNKEKQDELLNILQSYDIGNVVKLGAGTNRYAIKLDGFVVKIATDKDGKIDNKKEFRMARELAPYVARTYEVSSNGSLLVAEYVTPFVSYEEMCTYRESIKKILEDLSKQYLIGDVGLSERNYTNWGLRVGTKDPVCLDFAYVYRVSTELFVCDYCNNGSMLLPNDTYTKLVCSNPSCLETYTFEEIRARIGNNLHENEIGDLTKEGYELNESHTTVILDDKRSSYLRRKKKKKKKENISQEEIITEEIKGEEMNNVIQINGFTIDPSEIVDDNNIIKTDNVEIITDENQEVPLKVKIEVDQDEKPIDTLAFDSSTNTVSIEEITDEDIDDLDINDIDDDIYGENEIESHDPHICNHDHDEEEDDEDDTLGLIIDVERGNKYDILRIYNPAISGIGFIPIFSKLDKYKDKEIEFYDSRNGNWEWLTHMIPDIIGRTKDPEKYLVFNSNEYEFLTKEGFTVRTVIYGKSESTGDYLVGVYLIRGMKYTNPNDDTEYNIEDNELLLSNINKAIVSSLRNSDISYYNHTIEDFNDSSVNSSEDELRALLNVCTETLNKINNDSAIEDTQVENKSIEENNKPITEVNNTIKEDPKPEKQIEIKETIKEEDDIEFINDPSTIEINTSATTETEIKETVNNIQSSSDNSNIIKPIRRK